MDRTGYGSNLIHYDEGTWNSDAGITAGDVVPLADASGYGGSSDPQEVPIFMGDGMLPYDVVQGLLMAGGALPINLEYEFNGKAMKNFFTASGYARPGAGTNKEHHFFIPTSVGVEPGSFQLQAQFLEATAQYIRGRGNRISGISWEGGAAGPARETLDILGSGSMVQTDLAGTKTDNGFAASNYTDGKMIYTASGISTVLTDVNAFRCRLFNGASRREAFYNGGVAGAVNAFKINGEGELGFPLLTSGSGPALNLNFLNDAINNVEVDLDIIQANAPIAGGTATKFKRTQLQALRLIRMDPKPGGAAGQVMTQQWRLRRSDNAKTAAEYMLPTAGTYAVTGASNDKLGIKVDGGATQTITLTAGAARTVTQIVTDINATLTGAVADAYLGRYVRIVSATKGTTSSIQIDTGVAQTGHALFGADNVARAGRANCPVLIRIFNARTTDY